MAIQVVSIWNPKGGQGKSTFSINLAAAAVEMSIKPLVICQDPQGTAINFYNGGNLPFEVIEDVPKSQPDADIVIFDHPANDWTVPTASLIVMPLKPARDQYATYIQAKALAEAEDREIITVVTDGQMQRAEERDTTEALRKKGAFVVPSTGVFSRAAAEYRTIFDEKLNKAYKVGERRREMQTILSRILLNMPAK